MKPKRVILLVDDNDAALSVLKLVLETRGYRVIACSSGEQAIAAFAQGGIELVLSDLVLGVPGDGKMDGAELIRRVKEISPETRAILFSGSVKSWEFESAADVFLPKGQHRPAGLLERIRLLLIRERGPKPKKLSAIGDQQSARVMEASA
jgi:CheY-like chemotaxis protein